MALSPSTHVQLIITHMDDSETTIEFNERDATEWNYNHARIQVKRYSGWTCFPLATVKSYTIVYATNTAPARYHHACGTVHPVDYVPPRLSDLSARVSPETNSSG